MKYTLDQLDETFPNENTCLEYIFNKKYTKNCKKCGTGKYYRIKNRKCYSCSKCSYQIYPLKGTIFEGSSTDLKKWFQAMYFMAQSKNGVSAKELSKILGITHKCALRMTHKIRELMDASIEPGFLSGIVEVDECYIGGKTKGGKRGRGADNKVPVIGMVERGGKVCAKVTTRVTKEQVMEQITKTIATGSKLYTDEFRSYNGLKHAGYEHETVTHSKEEWARGTIHTNTIEGFWGQLKRSLHGTYHAVSPKYLPNYIQEFAFRYNHRYPEDHPFERLLDRI